MRLLGGVRGAPDDPTPVIWRLSQRPKGLPSWGYWTAALVAALMFAVGHLPFLFSLISEPPAWVITSVLVGNLLAGLGYGYLFWRHGIEAAMLAHGLSHTVAAALT